MVSRVLVLGLFCCACGSEPLAASPPLVPTDMPPPRSNAPRVPARSFESKTIGGDRYPVNRTPSTSATESGGAPTSSPSRNDPWSPTPLYGNKNPSPTAPGTPQFGDLNPSPPGPNTPRFGDLNPNPPAPGTPRYGDLNPSPPGR